MDDDAFDVFEFRQRAAGLRRVTLDLQIAASLIEKLREPEFLSAASQCVLPPGGPYAVLGATRTIHRAVRLEQLRRNDAHERSGRSAHDNSRHQRGVLPEIVNRHVRARRFGCDWLE